MFYLNLRCGLCDLTIVMANLTDPDYLLDKGVFSDNI